MLPHLPRALPTLIPYSQQQPQREQPQADLIRLLAGPGHASESEQEASASVASSVAGESLGGSEGYQFSDDAEAEDSSAHSSWA